MLDGADPAHFSLLSATVSCFAGHVLVGIDLRPSVNALQGFLLLIRTNRLLTRDPKVQAFLLEH
jgi:hypothetical protein